MVTASETVAADVLIDGDSVTAIGRNLDVHFDLDGGNRIPRIGERQARSVAELRAAGIGAE